MKKNIKENEFIQNITIIANNHGCEITSIYMDTKTINISGGKELECAIAIGDYFEKINNVEEISEPINNIKPLTKKISWTM